MCFFRRNRNEARPSRQQLRKMHRDTAKLERKVRRKAEHTLNNPSIPKWIRDQKRAQLERSGFLASKH